MIIVTVERKDTKLHKIEISGHAMYDVCGKDIVCSAVSTCVITTINGILEIDPQTIQTQQKENLISVEVLKEDIVTEKLLQNMISMLQELERQYPQNIKIH